MPFIVGVFLLYALWYGVQSNMLREPRVRLGVEEEGKEEMSKEVRYKDTIHRKMTVLNGNR